MPAKYLMSLDVGGSGGRCLLLNCETGETVSASRRWTHPNAPGLGNWAFDLDFENVWKILGEISRETLEKARVPPQVVVGISATSMRHNTVVIDREGRVTFATPNTDARGMNETLELADERGQELYQRTGHWPSPVMMAPRLMWLKEYRPEILDNARAVMSISDWVTYEMCGLATFEASQAGETLLFDLKDRGWADDVIQSLGLPRHIFPDIVTAGTRLGGLTGKAAAHLDLLPGIAVAAGGADTQCCLLGLGLTKPGQVGVAAGSTTPVMMITDDPRVDPKIRTWTGLHVLPGKFVIESNAGSMGNALEKIASILYTESQKPLAALCAEASYAPPGSGGVTSNVGAQVFNASSLGMPVDNLTLCALNTPAGTGGRSHIARAIIEGLAYSVRANIDQLLEVSGIAVNEVRVGGGITRSRIFTQVIGNLMSCPVQIGSTHETTGLGAAVCAGVGAGLYPDLEAAAGDLIKGMREEKSDPELAASYESHYANWNNLRIQRSPADSAAADIFIQAMMTSDESSAVSNAGANIRPRIFVSADAGEDAINLLRQLGDVTYSSYRDEGRVLTDDDLVEALQGYQVIVTEVDVVDAGVLSKLPDLRLVFVCRGNPVNIDIKACSAANVPVINTPGRNADAVADLAVSFILMLARKLNHAIEFLHEPGSEAGDMGRMGMAYLNFRGSELWHKTIGVIGGGAIGKRVIKRLLPFEARLLVYDPYITAEQSVLMGAEKVSLEELLEQSDFITLHAAVTDETRSLIDAAAFERMKPGVFLVNTARAALVDHDALLAALQSGKLGGAAFDVFPVEPPGADDPLLAFPNVIGTPHVGGNTNEVGIHQGTMIVDELRRLLNGGKPLYAINPETLEAFSWTGERQTDYNLLQELAKGPGPGMRDLDLRQNAEISPNPNSAPLPAAQPAPETLAAQTYHLEDEAPKSRGILSGLKKLLGGKSEAQNLSTPAPTGTVANPESKLPADVETKSAAFAGQSPTDSVFPGPSAAATKMEKFLQILSKFLSNLESDPDVQRFARGKNVIFQFTLKDINQVFYMSFMDGLVKTGQGESPTPPDVKLKMTADTLDGMFTGRVKATQAAMTGKISFSGDTSKAMAMQKMNFDTAYRKARQEVGDPGDLTKIASMAAATAPAPIQTASTLPVIPAPSSGQVEKYLQIVAKFLTYLEVDPEVQQFARGKNVMFHWTLKDANRVFYMSFVNGVVKAGLGEPPTPPDVRLKMNCDILDGMFTGRVKPTQAAMTGKISFSGDTGKAMAMQKMNFDKAYQKARQEVGDPGDLTKISSIPPVPAAAPPAPAAAVQAAPAALAPAASPVYAAPAVIHKTGDIRDEILQITNEMFIKGWITAIGGNISARDETNPELAWITPGSVFKGDLRADWMIHIDLDGNTVGESEFNASSERRVHCAIYRARPDVMAVIHTHAPKATLMAITGTKFLPISTEAAFLGDIPVVPFIMPGTPSLGDDVARLMGEKGCAVLMQNHGLVVAGSSLRSASNMTEIVEVTADKLLTCKMMGITPSLLPDDLVQTLQEMGAVIA